VDLHKFKRVSKAVRIILLVGILIALGVYSLIFALDWHVDGINPSDHKYNIPMSISVMFSSNQERIIIDIVVDVIVTYYGTLAAGRNATLFAAARLNTATAANNVSQIYVGFRFSYRYPLAYYDNHTAIQTWVYLERSGSSVSLSGYNASLFWPTAGYSPPYVRVIFKSGLEFYDSYPEYAIPIQPMSDLQAERANRVNVGLTVALVGFALVEGMSEVFDVLRERNESGTKAETENAYECKYYSNRYDDEYQ
jgi:hypothetical protein